jgi:hypothetical protein
MLTGFFVRWSIRLSFANAFTKIKAALSQDKSPLARNIMKGIIESEQIVKSKMGNAALVGGSSVISSKEKKGKNLIERYCDNCIKSVYSREQVL